MNTYVERTFGHCLVTRVLFRNGAMQTDLLRKRCDN
jgi:hypothetical protein